MEDADGLFQVVQQQTAGYADAAVARTLAEDSGRVVRWMQGLGCRFIRHAVDKQPHRAWTLAPPSQIGPGLVWEGRAGDVMLQTLEAVLAKRRRQAAARYPRAQAGDGKRALRGRGSRNRRGPVTIRAKAVVIADGGFQGDPGLVGANISPAPAKVLQRGAGTGAGDGLRMAREVGAQLSDLDCFYGHLMSIDAMGNQGLWPYPYVDSITAVAIVVNALGQRFADEGEGGTYIANQVARLEDPLSTTLIFDQAIWDGAGRAALIPSNPLLPQGGGTMHTCNDLAELAARIGVPAEALAQTVATYNEAVDSKDAANLSPPHTGKPQPIRVAPLHAIPVCAGMTYTMGGIAIDEHSRVRDGKGGTIPGLFAAGTTTGGVEGGPLVRYVGGLVRSSVSGYRAAERIVSELAA